MNRWSELQGGAPHFSGIGVLWVALRGVYSAAQNAVIAAESLGLGSQYIQEIVWQPYTTLSFFQLPKQVLPVAMLILGYPEERPPLAPSLPLEAVVHKEVYREPTDDDLLEHFASQETYFQEWLHSLPADSKLRKHIESEGHQDPGAVDLASHVHRELLQVEGRHGPDEPPPLGTGVECP